MIKDELVYDLYGAIFNNLSDTFDNTNQKIRGQQFGFREDQARGFGIINYVCCCSSHLDTEISLLKPKCA